jgi:hypothetical protein
MMSICSEPITSGSFPSWQAVSCFVIVLLTIDLLRHFWTVLIISFSSPVSDSQVYRKINNVKLNHVVAYVF